MLDNSNKGQNYFLEITSLAIILFCTSNGVYGGLLDVTNSQSQLETSWQLNGKFLYKIFHTRANFFEAEKNCQLYGANLASFEDIRELHFLQELAKRYSLVSRDYWIGLFNKNEMYDHSGYIFYFTDGGTFDADNWRESNGYSSVQVHRNHGNGALSPIIGNKLLDTKNPIFCSSIFRDHAIASTDCQQSRSAHICKVPEENFLLPTIIVPTKIVTKYSALMTTLGNITAATTTTIISSNNNVSNKLDENVKLSTLVSSSKSFSTSPSTKKIFHIVKMPEHMAIHRDSKIPPPSSTTEIANQIQPTIQIHECPYGIIQFIHCKIGPIGTIVLLVIILVTFIVISVTTGFCCYWHKKYLKKYVVYKARLPLSRKTSIAV